MAEEKYCKKQIVKSKKYRPRRDLLSALLKENIEYTAEEIEKIADDFLNREVR